MKNAKEARKADDAELSVEEARARLDEFFARLRDETLPPPNPLRGFRELLGLSRQQAAGLFYYSYTRWCAIEDGGIASVPNSVLKVVEGFFGPGSGYDFERAWGRFRANLGAETRSAVEQRLFPTGPGAMAP